MEEMFDTTQNIFIDYQNEILIIDGRKITEPIKVIIKKPDAWNAAKLFNSKEASQGMIYPELVIDVRNVYSGLRQQALKELIKDAIKEVFPAERAGKTGKDD